MQNIVVRQKRGGTVQVGASKLFGSPDVAEGFEWPAVINSKNCYDLDFLCQINLSQLADLDKDGILPNSGILYFFYDFYKSNGDVDDKNSARLVYSNSKQLFTLTMVDDEGVDCALCTPKALSFSRLVNSGEKPNISIPLTTDIEQGYTALFCISSFKIQNSTLHFTDIGKLYFLIKTEKLAERDFSDVRTKIVFS